jgi:hypothetical protein
MEAGNSSDASPEDIIRNIKLQGKVLMVFASTEDWPRWSIFIARYQALCRGLPPLRRCLFVIVVPRSERSNLPQEDVCLTVLRWDGILQNIDVRIITDDTTRFVEASWIERQLIASIGANLSLWDIELCELLVEAGLSTLIVPIDFLVEYGRSKGFESLLDDCSNGYLYDQGVREIIDGKYETHSAYLALQGDNDTIFRRIWKGQSSVLLSVIEDKRHRLAHELRDSWRLPHIGQDGEEIHRAEDLELGNMWFQVQNHYFQCPNRYRKLLRVLRKLRNSIAHREAIGLELVVALELIEEQE